MSITTNKFWSLVNYIGKCHDLIFFFLFSSLFLLSSLPLFASLSPPSLCSPSPPLAPPPLHSLSISIPSPPATTVSELSLHHHTTFVIAHPLPPLSLPSLPPLPPPSLLLFFLSPILPKDLSTKISVDNKNHKLLMELTNKIDRWIHYQ